MFGEKTIDGESIIPISNRGVLKLPKFTFAEPDDKLGLMFGLGQVSHELSARDALNRTRIVIMQLQEFEEKIQKADEDFKELKRSGQIDYRRYLELQRYLYAMIAISTETVSHLGKIEIPENPINTLKIGSSVYAVGEEKRLVLYPTREQYLSTLKK